MLYVGDEQGSAAILQELGDLVGVESGVEGNGRVAGGDGTEVGSHPARMVVREQRDARARGELFPVSQRPTDSAIFRVSA